MRLIATEEAFAPPAYITRQRYAKINGGFQSFARVFGSGLIERLRKY